MDSTNRGLVILLVVLLVLALGFSVLTGCMMGPGLMGRGLVGPGLMGGRWWLWGLGMGLGGLVVLLFWIALIAGLILLVRAGMGHASSLRSTPLDILKRRYAEGQITREQYEVMRKDLEQ